MTDGPHGNTILQESMNKHWYFFDDTHCRPSLVSSRFRVNVFCADDVNVGASHGWDGAIVFAPSDFGWMPITSFLGTEVQHAPDIPIARGLSSDTHVAREHKGCVCDCAAPRLCSLRRNERVGEACITSLTNQCCERCSCVTELYFNLNSAAAKNPSVLSTNPILAAKPALLGSRVYG
jgi:hypothetical protein